MSILLHKLVSCGIFLFVIVAGSFLESSTFSESVQISDRCMFSLMCSLSQLKFILGISVHNMTSSILILGILTLRKYYHVLVFGSKIWDWIITCFVVGIACFMVAYLRHSYSCSYGLLLIYFDFQIHLG
jgi:hypothetical protein